MCCTSFPIPIAIGIGTNYEPMIKFFRKIRHKLISKNPPAGRAARFSKYLIYAIGEIMLVVIGILIALQINNWNEDQKIQSEERKILLEIKNNIVQGVSSMDLALSLDSNHLELSLLILDHLKHKKNFTEELGRAFHLFPYGRLFPLPSSGYNSLQSKGVGIIKNDSLRIKISKLFDNTYPHLMFVEANDVTARRNELLSSEIYEHFMLTSKLFGESAEMLIPVDYEALLADTRFESMVRSITNNKHWYMSLKKEVKSEMENLIAEIEKELKK